ncbi:MAG: bifunctional DNA-formamidopyrimidine glycosylase/DNA-(apurinic or apyrimidinic site) lyase [Acidobacteriota bacterium]|nr:bifunctional DNA-formamidopyrimidine glycosylase/DNA-(apurinic or apyrimidinic site) lyase [Acidobacteriota bacterium]MDQ7087837.1 bifunctional DNA-formamidopyrimidine glycosylase/DNA-(apurinic or apyrimidinic site) lyase [Acidobacteriota bacterium]
MPELPEVETVVRQLRPQVTGRHLKRLQVFDPRLKPGRAPRLPGSRIHRVLRVGKQVLFEVGRKQPEKAPGRAFLACHLRMTGRLIWKPKRDDRGPHLRATLVLEDGVVDFIDPRRFGTLRWLRRIEEAEPGGIDPLSPAFTAPVLRRLLAGSRQELKVWLLRQDRLAGLGNIYACEILHRAGLAPRRAAGRLSAAEIQRLFGAIGEILDAAIEKCGTTFSDFQDARGEQGDYQAMLEVYGREGEGCRRCRRGKIRRIVQQQRSTFFCPVCQNRRHRRAGPGKAG